MAVTNYHTVNGRILGETTAGTRTDYITDALGSVVATADQNANVVNTYTYKPYGEQLAKTGAGSDPKFRWVGVHGYRQTGKEFSDLYVRARHYSSPACGWTTPDPLKTGCPASPYVYVKQNPMSHLDPTGLRTELPPWCSNEDWGGEGSLKDCFSKLRHAIKKIRGTPREKEIIKKCLTDNGVRNGREIFDDIWNVLDQKGEPTLCVFCRSPEGNWGITDPDCVAYLMNLCFSRLDIVSSTVPPFDVIPIKLPWGGLGCVPGTRFEQSVKCLQKLRLRGQECDCAMISCIYNNPGGPGCCYHIPVHEILHCVTKWAHQPGTNPRRGRTDWLYEAAGCLCKELFSKTASECECAGVRI